MTDVLIDGSRRRARCVRQQRRAEQTAVPAGVDEAGKQLRIGAPAGGLAEQPHHRVARAAAIDVELRGEVVRQRQIGIQLERAMQCVLRAREVLAAAAAKLADEPPDASERAPTPAHSGDPPASACS